MAHSIAGSASGSLPPRRFRGGKPPKRRLALRRFGSFLALLMVFAAASWTGQSLLPSVEESFILAEGRIETIVDIEAFVVRDERVAHAPVTGTVRFLVSEGERVRIGTGVVEIHPDGALTPTVMQADLSGVVHFETDGLEGILLPTLVDRWSPEWFSSLPLPATRATKEGRVQAGQPLFKIVDSLERGLVGHLPERLLGMIAPGRQVGLRIGVRDGGLYPGRLTHIERSSDLALIYIVAEHLPEVMSITRRARVSILLRTLSGKVVPISAIDVRNGLQGIWTMETGLSTFNPVKVVGGDPSHVVIEAQIPLGTRIRRVAPSYPD